MKEIVKGLNGQHDDLYANGLHIAGERYVLTKVEDENKVLYARKVRIMLSVSNRFIQPYASSIPSSTHTIITTHDIFRIPLYVRIPFYQIY